MTKKQRYSFLSITKRGANRRVSDALEDLEVVAHKLRTGTAELEAHRNEGIVLAYEILGRCLTDKQERIKVQESLGVNLKSKDKRQKLFNAVLKDRLGVEKSLASRIASCLRWALHSKVSVNDLPEFLDNNGGVSGCAEKYRELKASRLPAPKPSDPSSKADSPMLVEVAPKIAKRIRAWKKPFRLRCAWDAQAKKLSVLGFLPVKKTGRKKSTP